MRRHRVGIREKTKMNKSYRTLWNESTRSWVAAAETTKTRGKRSGSAVRAQVATSVLALMAMAGAHAEIGIDGGEIGDLCSRPNASANWTCQVPNAAGGFSTVSGVPSASNGKGPDYAVLNNWLATRLGSNAIALGSQATQAGGDNAIAIGNGAQAVGTSSISIGTGNIVSGNRSGAIGDPSIINGTDSYSVGNNNTIGSTTANAFALGNNIYLGADAKGVDTASVSGAVALGSNASVTQPGGVALGQGSVASTPANVSGYDPSTGSISSDTSPTWRSTLAAVSVGGPGNTRQITNVAAGQSETDAVNVAQLQAVSNQVASGAVHYFSVNDASR